MSIVDSVAERAGAAHPCTNCNHRDGEQCKWSDTAAAAPHHITWWPIDWDEPELTKDCAANTSRDPDEWEG